MLLYRIGVISKTAGDIKIFRMEPVGAALSHRPGQFVMVHLLGKSGASDDKRPYSIASAPGSPYLEFCIKMAGGAFTSRLDTAKVGDVLGVEGPMGPAGFGDGKYVLICGGTGIAPVMSIVRDASRRKETKECFVFYSAKKRDLLVYYDELLELGGKNPAIKVIFTLTREEPKGWAGRCGRLDEGMLREYLANPKEFTWFICGPMEMAKTMRECAIRMGADPRRVLVEGWG